MGHTNKCPEVLHVQITPTFRSLVRVSSVQNRDVKQFGKKYMFDDNEETCWSSDQGCPQWVELQSEDCEKEITSFSIQFQGGFAGKDCVLEVKSNKTNETRREPFYPEDVNTLQKFTLKTPTIGDTFRFLFINSTDFFGRIVIYKLILH